MGRRGSVARWAAAARAGWRYVGDERPPFARVPEQGQRSVWDFPRPPVIEPVREELRPFTGAPGTESL